MSRPTSARTNCSCRSRRWTTFPSSSRSRSAWRATPAFPDKRAVVCEGRRGPGASSTSASTGSPAPWPAWASAAATRSPSSPPTRSSISRPSWAACAPAPAWCRCRPWRRPMRWRRCSTIATPRCCSCRTSTAAWSSPTTDRLSKLIAGGRIAYDFKRAGWRDFEAWLAPASDAPFEVPLEPARRFQHHLQLRHDRPAQGHPAQPRHARPSGGAVHGVRLRPGHDLARLDAALFQHDARRRAGDGRRRRHDHPDAEVRRREIPRDRPARACDPRHAGAGAVPAHPGASGLRQVRPRRPSSASCRPARRCAPTSRPIA